MFVVLCWISVCVFCRDVVTGEHVECREGLD